MYLQFGSNWTPRRYSRRGEFLWFFHWDSSKKMSPVRPQLDLRPHNTGESQVMQRGIGDDDGQWHMASSVEGDGRLRTAESNTA
jgi:hypothetical protein